jgi:hypothetical protein
MTPEALVSCVWLLPLGDVVPEPIGSSGRTLYLGLAAFLTIVALGWLFVRRRSFRAADVGAAQSAFLAARPDLESHFLRAASATGKPRGLRWTACEWGDGVEFAREKQTGRLAALVGVTIQFEAIEGGDMEGLPAVGNLRNASAVFFYDRGKWHTTGKAVFNLNPDEALTRFASQYERLPA